MINVPEVKQKILKFLDERGPSLPVHIMKVTEMNLIISSAILSEMLNEKTIKQSHLKIGSSSLYLIPGQEFKLENFSDNLKGVEKEAFLKLKKARFLEEEKQDSVTRVALKSLKDFAIPVKVNENLIWKYFLTKNEEITNVGKEELKENLKEIRPIAEHISKEIIYNKDQEEYKGRINQIAQEIEPKQKELEQEKEKVLERVIFHQKTTPEIVLTSEPNKEEKTKKKEKHLENQFFLEIKEKIISWAGSLIEAVYVNKKELIIRAVLNGNELLLFAFDKKRVSESDIIKLKRKTNIKLPLFILSKSEMPKKMKETMEVYKNIAGTGIF